MSTRRHSTTAYPLDRDYVYSSEGRDFALFLNGQAVGFARSAQEAESTLDELAYTQLVTSPLTEAEALAHELCDLHPGLALADALAIATRKADKVLAFAAEYDALVAAERPETSCRAA